MRRITPVLKDPDPIRSGTAQGMTTPKEQAEPIQEHGSATDPEDLGTKAGEDTRRRKTAKKTTKRTVAKKTTKKTATKTTPKKTPAVEKVKGEVVERHGVEFATLDRSKAGQRIDPARPAIYGNKKGGHGYKITEATVNKLEEAFMMGCSNLEACAKAGISRTIFYRWLKENPDFQEHIDELRSMPTMTARTNIVDSLRDGNVDTSRWYLERKARDEFGAKAEISLNSAVSLGLTDARSAADKLVESYLAKLEDGSTRPPTE